MPLPNFETSLLLERRNSLDHRKMTLVSLSGLPQKAMSTKPFLSLSGEEEMDKSFVPDRMVSAGVVEYQGKEKLLHFLQSDLELQSRYHHSGHIPVHLQPSLSSHLEDITAELIRVISIVL